MNGPVTAPVNAPAGGAVSARGLFRATGRQAAEERARPADDFYPTPPEPVRALIAAERGRLSRYPAIWEPACGDGAMAREIEAGLGLPVIASDIRDRGWPGTHLCDFLTTEAALAPAMVTNPPYCLINWRDGRGAWLSHALGRLRMPYVALLLSWSWPGAGGLAGLWSRWPPSRVYLCRWKIDFTGQGAPPMLSAWFVWERGPGGDGGGETVLRMLDRHGDARQGALWEAGEAGCATERGAGRGAGGGRAASSPLSALARARPRTPVFRSSRGGWGGSDPGCGGLSGGRGAGVVE